MMVGHQFLKKEFDITPTIGWNIDDFGHSDANTRLFQEMGFDA
jgi:alpha-mannosidase